MNVLFLILVLGATVASALAELSGHSAVLTALTETTVKSAQDAIQLALTLAASMAVFMGVLRVAELADILTLLARPLTPLLRVLFPQQKERLETIALNVSANLLGMGNAATPFGLKAMAQMEETNPNPGIASDAQIMFLALNTAGITLLPAKVIALRASLGSVDPAAIVGPTLAASLSAAVAGLFAAWAFSARQTMPRPRGIWWLAPLGLIAMLAVFMVKLGGIIGPLLVPGMIAGLLLWGYMRGVNVYDGFIEGARDGLITTWRITPYLLTIMVAVGMARGSGALEYLTEPLGQMLAPLGLPPQALIMAVVRTLSGSGAFGLLATDLAQSGSGPDTPLGLLLSTIYGSTETTFYVIAVYFGAVGTKSLRHAITVGLIADLAGLITATLICG